MNTNQFYIDGAWVDPIDGTSLDVINPSTEEVFATISLGGEADTESAVTAAKRAFDTWSQSSKADRLALMHRILEVYTSRSEEMAHTISEEMGAPIDMSKAAQSGTGLAYVDLSLHGTGR